MFKELFTEATKPIFNKEEKQIIKFAKNSAKEGKNYPTEKIIGASSMIHNGKPAIVIFYQKAGTSTWDVDPDGYDYSFDEVDRSLYPDKFHSKKSIVKEYGSGWSQRVTVSQTYLIIYLKGSINIETAKDLLVDYDYTEDKNIINIDTGLENKESEIKKLFSGYTNVKIKASGYYAANDNKKWVNIYQIKIT